jgi:hypothetical protein
VFGQTPSGIRKTLAAKDELKMNTGALRNLGQSNKVKLGMAIFVIGIFVLPFGWKVSTILAGDFTDPRVATLVALDPPAEFEAVVKAMGFVVSERARFAELDMATTRVRSPKGVV